jgi:hypothetical protein
LRGNQLPAALWEPVKTEKESENDNRDNHSVTPTLCHGKVDL